MLPSIVYLFLVCSDLRLVNIVTNKFMLVDSKLR